MSRDIVDTPRPGTSQCADTAHFHPLQGQRQSGNAAHCETLLGASRIASELGDAGLAASAALANNTGWSSGVVGEVDKEVLGAIERAIELDDPPHPARRARLLALQATELQYDPDFRRRWAVADEAASLARGVGDARTLAEVLHLAFYAYWTAGTQEKRAALSEELSDRASSLRDPALHFWMRVDECYVNLERGQFDRMQAALKQMVLIAGAWPADATVGRHIHHRRLGDLVRQSPCRRTPR